MRLKKFHNFKINESIKEKFLSTDDIDYLLQSIKDQYEFDKFSLEYKLFKHIDLEDPESNKLYGSIKPGLEGNIGYKIDLYFEGIEIEKDIDPYKSKIDPESGFELLYDPESYASESYRDVDYTLSSNAKMDREIEKFIKRLRATFDISEIEYSVDGERIRTKIRPIITLLMYNPEPITISVQDFVDFYQIKDYVIEDNKLYMDVLMTDLTDLFLSDEQQEMWIDQGYVDYDMYNANEYVNDEAVIGELNKDNEALIINHFVVQSFDGDINKMKESAKESNHNDLIDFIFEEFTENDEILEVISTYRDMYIQGLADDDYRLLRTEMMDYIYEQCGVTDVEVVGRKMDDKTYQLNRKNNKSGKAVSVNVETEILRIEFPHDAFGLLDYKNVIGYTGDTLWDVWKDLIGDVSKTYLKTDGVSYTDINREEFNEEVAHIFTP